MESTEDLGLALRAKREAAGRTLRDVADVTKLGVRTLEALERNQIERLPPGIFRRSVVRAYAREIGLDPEATLLAFLARFPDGLPPPGRTTGPIADAPLRMTRMSGVSPWLVVALAVAVVVLLVVVAWQWRQRVASHGVADAGGRVAEVAVVPPAAVGGA